jgi:hypothetical protein
MSTKKSDDSPKMWGLLSGAFRSSSWGQPSQGETQPVPAQVIVNDEVKRQLRRSGLAEECYEMRLIPATHGKDRDADEDHWMVYVRLKHWSRGALHAITHLEWNLQHQLKSSGLEIRAVYWRVQAEVVKDLQKEGSIR